MRLARLAVALALGAFASSPAASASEAAASEQVTKVLREHAQLALGSYREAVAGLHDLQAAVRELLAHPSKPSLEKARAAWIACRDAYGRTEALRFSHGPIDDLHPITGVQGPEGRINPWPIDEAYLDYVAGEPTSGLISDWRVPMAESTLVSRNAAGDETQVTLGYHAIEFLLWGQDRSREGPGTRPYTDYVSGDPIRDRRRACLRLQVELLIRDLTYVADEWTPGPGRYVNTFLALPPAEALGRALSGPATLAAFELASERIGIPLSTGMQEHEQSCFSDNTHRDIAADVDGIARVLEGDSTHAGLLAALDAASAQEIRERLTRIRKLAHAIVPPFDAILSSDEFDPRRRGLQALMGELLGLSGAIQRAGEAAGARVMIGGGG